MSKQSGNGVPFDTIKAFAPKIYLHPYDNQHPVSIENYLQTVWLLDKDKEVLSKDVTPDVLIQYNTSENYTRGADDRFPTAKDDFQTGDKIEATSNSGVGQCKSPVYVKTFSWDTHVDIKYAMFYAMNTFQVFRAGIGYGVTTKKRTFPWARFARHEGDWEHVTVRLDSSCKNILGAFYSQHGKSDWVSEPPLEDGTHPVCFSALNTHANYPNAANKTLDHILHPPGLSPVRWLKAIDTTMRNAEKPRGGLRVYKDPEPFFREVRWLPYENDSQIVVVDDNPEACKWLDVKGRWGPPKLSNKHIDRPPKLPDKAQNFLFDYAKVAKAFLKNKYLVGNGPRGPKQQDWWLQKEP